MKGENMIIKPNWNSFKAKFSENPQDNFEWFCYLLFSKEYNQPYGTHRYKNQSGIETDPIEVGDEVIGWQSKFYEDSLSNHKEDLLGTLTKTKRDNPNITKIILYTNSEWGQGQGTKEPKAKTETEEKAKELKIDLVWRVKSYFESSFVCQEQQDISRYFFELDSKWELTNLGFIDTIKDRYKTTFKNACEYIVENSFSLKKEPELPSEIIENSIKETNIKNILLESNKSLIFIKSTFIKDNFNKYLAYLWCENKIYKEFKFLVYISLVKWKSGGLKGLIRDNYYSLDEDIINLDIKNNNKNFLFLFDDIDKINDEKRQIIKDEIEKHKLLNYIFTSYPRINFLNEFKFNKKFNLTLITSKLEKSENYSSFKVNVCNFLENHYKNITYNVLIDENLYSKDIEETIPFDIVINFNLPFKMRVIVKCFYDSDNITLNDIKFFYNLKEEVSAQKVIIVSSLPFNSNMINYSKKKNGDISLLYFPNNFKNINWTLERRSTTFVKMIEDKPEFVVELFLANNKNNLLSNYRLIPNRNLNKVTFINDSEIDKIVLNILSKIGYKDGIVDLNKIIRFVENKNNIYTKYNQSLEKDVLGEINFEKSVISIDNYQCETLARIRFTLAHEIGHFLLGHSKYLLTEKYTKQDAETINSQNIIKIEFQANQFASFLLLPTKSFLKDFYALLKEYNVRDRGLGLFVDNQKCNINTYMKVISRLMHKYKVSRQVIEIRLKKLGLLNKVDTYELVKDVHQEIINKKLDWNYYD